MATKPGWCYEFPWHRMGNWKYALYGLPLVGHLPQWITAPIGLAHLEGSDTQAFFDVIVLVTIVRYMVLFAIQAASRLDAISQRTRIQEQDFGFEQVDQEDDWDHVIMMNCFTFCALYCTLPVSLLPQRLSGAAEIGTVDGASEMPFFDWRGYALALAIQVGPVEVIYYWFHRALHTGYLWKSYHSHHHSAFVTEAISGNSHPLFENFCYMALFSTTLLVPWYLGWCSLSLFFVYTSMFDFTNAMGHCNFEFLPNIFNKAPLKYLMYTPSYHSIHHSRVHYNFCLFMPYMDYLCGTVHEVTDITCVLFFFLFFLGRPMPLHLQWSRSWWHVAPSFFFFCLPTIDPLHSQSHQLRACAFYVFSFLVCSCMLSPVCCVQKIQQL